MFKVNPPLRTAADIAALKAGLADGTIDAIATDHAPHPAEDKERPLDEAPPGMLGLETALGVALAELDMPLGRRGRRAVVEAGGDRRASATATAARSRSASPANLVVFDPDERWQVAPGGAGQPQPQHAVSSGVDLRGRVRHTVFRGTPVVIDGAAQR